jgi:hypothetical protein
MEHAPRNTPRMIAKLITGATSTVLLLSPLVFANLLALTTLHAPTLALDSSATPPI